MNRTSAAAAGLVAVVAAIAVTESVVLVLPAGRPVVAAIADAVIQATPGALARWTVRVFRGASRAVLFTSMAAVLAFAGAAIGIASKRAPTGAAIAVAVIAGGALLVAVTDPFIPAVSAVVGPVAGAVAALGVLHRAMSRPASPVGVDRAAADVDDRAAGVHTDPGDDRGSWGESGAADRAEVWDDRTAMHRRRFLGLSLTAAAGLLTAVVAGRAARSWLLPAPIDVTLPPPTAPLKAPSPAMSFEIGDLTPLITPNVEFYRIDTATAVPRIATDSYTIQIIGMVDEPFAISYDELLELSDTEVDVTLACVSNEVGGGLVGNARWLGVPLTTLLDRAGVHEGADQLVARAIDGWTAGFPVEVARDGRPAIVAVGMNGEPLPRQHGFPARLVVAGLYGYVSDTKWLSQIELTTFDAYDAYWVERGWDRFGPVQTQTRIDVPGSGPVNAGTTPIAGVAWAGQRGISAVEVAIDGGPWRPARLADELAATSWRQWMLEWEASAGTHEIRARATDGDGVVQTAHVRPPEPSGATGHHLIRVRVV